jgi:hypothetical protein
MTQYPTRAQYRRIVRHIVARCHVAENYRSVMRYVLSRFTPGYYASLPRFQRRRLWKAIMAEREVNRDLFYRVARGF